METLFLVLFGYFMGSIPTAYIATRMVKGIDLRRVGSGTVSGSGVYDHVSVWVMVPVGLFDLAKGALPAWLGLQLGPDLSLAVAAGLAAVIGHNWSIFLRFTGGRGFSPFLGMMLVIFPWAFRWMMVFMGFGLLFKIHGLMALLGLISLTLLTWVTDQPAAVTGACLAMWPITAIKRIEANRRPLPADPVGRRKVLLRRLLTDRDVRRGEPWTRRTS
jgi:glycerol-3-phosphate acyltransferase PlsY